MLGFTLYWAATQIFANFSNATFLQILSDASVCTAKRRGIDKRVPYFFSCVENTLGLTCEERAYIRSAEPLYLDGHLHAFVHHLQLSYQRSGSPLGYEQWIRQTYLGETPGRSLGAIK